VHVCDIFVKKFANSNLMQVYIGFLIWFGSTRSKVLMFLDRFRSIQAWTVLSLSDTDTDFSCCEVWFIFAQCMCVLFCVRLTGVERIINTQCLFILQLCNIIIANESCKRKGHVKCVDFSTIEYARWSMLTIRRKSRKMQ